MPAYKADAPSLHGAPQWSVHRCSHKCLSGFARLTNCTYPTLALRSSIIRTWSDLKPSQLICILKALIAMQTLDLALQLDLPLYATRS